jgi:hypothetical protein
MRRNPIRPDPAELRLIAGLARTTAEDLAPVVPAARTAGVTVDDEIYQCSAAVTSWAGWLAARAAPKDDT